MTLPAFYTLTPLSGEVGKQEVQGFRDAFAIARDLASRDEGHDVLIRNEREALSWMVPANPADDGWVPAYEPWRHGGWYVTNVRYPSGGCGCVSRNYPDGEWRIACDERPGDHTYPSRDAAARAERVLAARAPAESR